MRRTLVLLAMSLCLIPSSSWARQLGSFTIEGVDNKTAKAAREKIQNILKPNFNLEDVQTALQVLFNSESLNGAEVFYEEQGEKTHVIFRLIPQRTVKTVIFHGNHAFSNSDLTAELGIMEGEGFAEDKVKAGVENIKKFYNLNGYLNAQVSADFASNENSPDISINVHVEEGPPCLVDKITFKSINKKLNGELEDLFKKFLKKPFSQTALNNIQNESSDYLLEHRFFSATIQGSDTSFDPPRTHVVLTYVVTDPYSFSLVFEGNEAFTGAKLLKELKLDAANRLSGSPVDDLTERILKFYKKAGYANVSVKHAENIFTQDFVRRVNFNINEGKRVRIKDIVIEGTHSRPTDYYREFIFDHSSDLIGKKLYNSEDLEDGIKNLVIELQNQGFIAAKVPTTRVDYDKTREYVTIRIALDEGPQTIVDKIAFNGIKHIPSNELEQTIGLKEGAPLQLNALADASTKIVSLYRSRGYLDAQVLNQGKSLISYSADNTKATLTFEISEGPLVTVSSIIVEGNSFTKEYVIVRELQFHPGEVLTPEKINYSEVRLQRLSLFGAIDIKPIEDDPREGNRTILVHVTERNPGLFKSGVGVDNELTLTLKGFVGAAYRNLWGTGRGVNARVEINDKVKYSFIENDSNLGYTEPFILGTENTGKLILTRSTKLFSISTNPIVGNPDLVYAVDSTQGDIILERDITQRLKLIYEFYGIAHTNTFEIKNQTPPTPLDIATTGPTFEYDKRDNSFNPTRGDLTKLSFEYSNPLMGSTQTVSYYKTVASFAKFIPIGRMVWANEIKGGYMRNLSTLFDGNIPQIKAFVLGGRSTIRGFDPSEAFPRTTEFPSSAPGVYYGIRTDSYFFLTKSELQFPIYGSLAGVVFYDGGEVGFPEYRPVFPWRDSVGVGLRYVTPVGPVTAEIGQKLNRDTTRGEIPWAFHFGIGVF